MNSIPIEQAVYGSFPFWDRGYAVLARSPGCREEWVDAFTAACSRFGERPRDVNRADALFALRLTSGPWMIVGVREQGADDRGRPGALAFHALFVSDTDYRQSGASPFAFARWHQSHWGPGTTSLPPLSVPIETDPASANSPLVWLWRSLRRHGRANPSITTNPTQPASRAARIARALSQSQRVAIAANSPIDSLAHQVWNHLSPRQRAQKTVSTWVFSTQNGFDLVGLPDRPNLTIPSGYVTEAQLIDPPSRSRPLLRSAAPALRRNGPFRPRGSLVHAHRPSNHRSRTPGPAHLPTS